MIVATNTIKIQSGHADAVAERFKNPKGVHQAPGFVRMELLKSEEEGYDELKVCTTWESREAFDAWVNSDAFKQAHARPSAASGGQQPAGSSASGGYHVTGGQQSAGSSASGGHHVTGGEHAASSVAPGSHGEHVAGSVAPGSHGEHATSTAAPGGHGHHAASSAVPGGHGGHVPSSTAPGSHGGHGAHSGGTALQGGQPASVMLGSKLSVHEVLFTL